MQTQTSKWTFSHEGKTYTLPQAINHLYFLEEDMRTLSTKHGSRLSIFFGALVLPVIIALGLLKTGMDHSVSDLVGAGIGFIVFSLFAGMILSVITEDFMPANFLRPKQYLPTLNETTMFKAALVKSLGQYLEVVYDAHARQEVLERIAEGASGYFTISKNEGGSYRCFARSNGEDLDFMRQVTVHSSEVSL